MSQALPATVQPAEPVIPYRTASEVSGGDIAGAFGAAIALLVLALAAAWLARRLGWMQRWGVGPAGAPAPAHSLRIEQTLRLSPRTVLYRIADGDQRFLLAETREGVQWLPLAAAGPRPEAAHAP